MSASAGSAALPAAVTHELGSALPFGQALSPRTFVGVLVAALLAFAAVAIYQRIRVARSGIAGVDRMDVKTFEAFLASLFRDLGYQIEGSRVHGDFAAELVVVKDGTRTVVEGKRWSKNLGVTAVQAALGAMTDFACDAAIVVANRQFTHQAKRLAKSNRHPALGPGGAGGQAAGSARGPRRAAELRRRDPRARRDRHPAAAARGARSPPSPSRSHRS